MKAFMMMQYSKQVFGFFVMDTGFHEPKNTAAIISKSVYMKTFHNMELLMSLRWSLNLSSISKIQNIHNRIEDLAYTQLN